MQLSSELVIVAIEEDTIGTSGRRDCVSKLKAQSEAPTIENEILAPIGSVTQFSFPSATHPPFQARMAAGLPTAETTARSGIAARHF
jgi:hypothetical protein